VRASRVAIEDLRAKYAEMLTMRLEHAAGDEDVRAMRAKMSALAARFPGALREIDRLELHEIRRRITALDEVLDERRDVIAPWMEALVQFHALARGALVAKRWLGGRKRVDSKLQRQFAQSVPALAFPEDAGQWGNDLARLAEPPGGRWTTLVFRRVGETLGVSEREARQLVFGE
jgi:hypothetical protein